MSAYYLATALRCIRIALVIAGAICNTLISAGEKNPVDPNSSEQSSNKNDSNGARTAREFRGATSMLPLVDESPAKIIIDPPLPELLARGMALIQFRTENLRLFPAFGPEALNVSPRIGHLHVRLDDNPWGWAHTSGDDLIINRLLPGSHKVQIELADANHKILAKYAVHFEVPQGPHVASSPAEHQIVSDSNPKGQPSAKIHVDPPPADRLAHGVALFQCRFENAQIASVFGPAAVDVSPRICHLHVTVDDARWRWADTSGGPVILAGLPPGPHKILIELVNANHKPITSRVVDFEMPESSREKPDTGASEKSGPGTR